MRKPKYSNTPCAIKGCRYAAVVFPDGERTQHCLRHLPEDDMQRFRVAVGMTGKTRSVRVADFLIYRGGDYITVLQDGYALPMFECPVKRVDAEIKEFRETKPDWWALDPICDAVAELTKGE